MMTMYFKVIQRTEFDALEGSVQMATNQIIFCFIARTMAEAITLVEKLKEGGILDLRVDYEIEEATQEEYLAFIEG